MKTYALDMGDYNHHFTADFDTTLRDDSDSYFKMTEERWTFTLAGGMNVINHGSSHLTTPGGYQTLQLNTSFNSLNWPSQTYSANNFKNGYAGLATLTRQVNDWIALGAQGGASFGNMQEVQDGKIFFLAINANSASITLANYEIDYRVYVYHLEPIVVLGRYVSIGRFAWKPYLMAGAGAQTIQEKVVFRGVGADFDIGQRTSSVMDVVGGAGIDFRISSAGSIGLQYQMQRVVSSGHDWTFSNPTARFSYLF